MGKDGGARECNAMNPKWGLTEPLSQKRILPPPSWPPSRNEIKEHRPIKPKNDQLRRQCYISASDLICRARGQITPAAIRENVATALGHLEAWLSGHPAIDRDQRAGSMATAELCRAQLWQWIRHSARLAAGDKVDKVWLNVSSAISRQPRHAALARLNLPPPSSPRPAKSCLTPARATSNLR